jgi:hypothetical protein
MITVHRNTLRAAALLISALCQLPVHASPEVGKQLSATELANLQGQVNHKVNGRVLIQLPSVASHAQANGNANTATPTSWVVNENGVVGRSRNEVLVARLSTQDVREKLGSLASAPVSIQYFDHMDITSLRFGTLAQAVAAREQLQTLLPKGQVSLPVQFHQPKLR